MCSQHPSKEMKPLIRTFVIVKISHCDLKGKESASYLKSLYKLKVGISSFILFRVMYFLSFFFFFNHVS